MTTARQNGKPLDWQAGGLGLWISCWSIGGQDHCFINVVADTPAARRLLGRYRRWRQQAGEPPAFGTRQAALDHLARWDAWVSIQSHKGSP